MSMETEDKTWAVVDNCVRLRCISPFHFRLMFIDTQENVSERVFISSGLKVWDVKELVKKDSPFRLKICYIRKKDIERFFRCLDELKRKVLLMGYTEYDIICSYLMRAEEDILSNIRS